MTLYHIFFSFKRPVIKLVQKNMDFVAREFSLCRIAQNIFILDIRIVNIQQIQPYN